MIITSNELRGYAAQLHPDRRGYGLALADHVSLDALQFRLLTLADALDQGMEVRAAPGVPLTLRGSKPR